MTLPSYRSVTFRVRYSETDQMKVTYHTNYLNWFEWGRTEFIREGGFTYAELEEKGVLLPLTDATISFKAPAKLDELVEVRTRIQLLSPLRLEFASEVRRAGDQQLLVIGETKHVFTNPELKPIRMSKLFPEVYDWLKAEFERSQTMLAQENNLLSRV